MIYLSSNKVRGRIAQLGEHLPYKQGVTGSSPVVTTIYGGVAQLVRVLACHARCREFESRHFRHYAQIAQSVEQGTENPCVRGSIPRLGTIFKTKYILLYEIQFVRDNKLYFLLITEYKFLFWKYIVKLV